MHTKLLHLLSLTPSLPFFSLQPQSMWSKESNQKSNKLLYWPHGGNAVGTKLLHLQAQKHRQQPSHLSVINPYSPSAAFLPFTTNCLKLKRRAEGKTLKLQSQGKSKIVRERKGKEVKIREGGLGLRLDSGNLIKQFTIYSLPFNSNTITGAFPK